MLFLMMMLMMTLLAETICGKCYAGKTKLLQSTGEDNEENPSFFRA